MADGDPTNVSDRFERLPPTDADRLVPHRPSRASIVTFFEDRFGIPTDTFARHTFWEKGNGKIWAFHSDTADPIAIEALGMHVLRVRQDHWKPTTNAVQRFGRRATKNVVHLDEPSARAYWDGIDQPIDWDGDWGYLIVAMELAGESVPLGVGLYLHGELRSVVPKGRQRTIPPLGRGSSG